MIGRSHRPWLTCLLLLLAIPVMPARAQGPALLAGQRVRITTAGTSQARTTGRIETVDRAAIVVRDDDRAVTIGRPEVSRLEVVSGTRGHARTGALIGGGIMLGSGIVGTLAVAEETDGTPGDGVAVGAMVLVTLVAVPVMAGVGALIGSMFRSDRWVEVPLDTVWPAPLDPLFGTGQGHATGAAP